MRVREPAGGGPVTGYIYDEGGMPTMIVALDLYMDAPGASYRLEDSNGFGGDVDMHFSGIHSIRAGVSYNFSM